jgi:TonB family protein
LAAPLTLPVQYHTDVLSSTVVEAMVGRDGLVISARVIENSGSARADAEALGLARKARFSPVNTAENVPVVGKLIFEWFALSLSHTNSVTR